MKFLHASMLVAGFMLLGRITGFLREIVIAQIGGASQQSDVVIVFLTFPDMMISLLLGSGLMAALVPSFRSLPGAAAVALLVRAGLLIGAVFGLLAVFLALFSGETLGIVAPGWPDDLITASESLFRITLIALPITALSGVTVAFLNSSERFTFGAIGTLIFNACLIASLLIFAKLSPVVAVVIGILGGAGLRLLVQLTASRRFLEKPDFAVPYDRADLLRRFAGSFGFFSILALLPPLARAFASLVEPGALSMFNYAYKLMELPMAIIVTAIVTVLLPRLSGHVRDGQADLAARNLGMALRAVGILLLGVAISTAFQAEAVVRLVFYGAPFTPEQFRDLGMIVSLGFIGVPFQGLVLLYGTAFVSYERTAALVLASLLMVSVMGGAGLILLNIWGVKGVMAAYVASQVAGAALLTVWLLRFTGRQPFTIALAKPLVSILLPAAACLTLSWIFRATEFWGLPALLLSAGVFFAVHIGTDPNLIKAITNRRTT
ncbi:MAG: lipid II flippase MurJ [Roseovarius sp.]|nr:lipid II flippase MurJ [Roseovarius sp.]